MIEPSFLDALPYFIPIAIFPLVCAAAMYGGWWLAGPFAFFWVADNLDTWLRRAFVRSTCRSSLPSLVS
ncbi:MAG: hypothetical protein OXC54_03135, partial [Rhodospirillaceae bacterium]|nr:hypothetical protein [Rhodospirillaceae bacterium]